MMSDLHVRGSTGVFLGLFIGLLAIGHDSIEESVSPNPQIVEQPTDNYVARNDPAKLNCKAVGDPTPTITWYRNGKRVTTDAENPTSHRMLLNNGQQLFFLRIIHNKSSKPDVGQYYCNATNRHGSVVSRNVSLQLAVLRDDFREMPRSIVSATGDTARFHCVPPRGEPEPQVAWRRNGLLLSSEGRMTIEENGDLVIVTVQRADDADYTCLAINKAGERESSPVSLTVLEKPRFYQTPDDVIAKQDDKVELTCSATGDPQPSIQWRKEDGIVPFGSRARQLADGTLWIDNVQAEDDGLYVCMAENIAGSVRAVGRLSVHNMPSFLISPFSQVVGRGRSVNLECVVTGNPPPTVFWSKGQEQHLMFPNHKSGRYSVTADGTLHIRNVQYEDGGQYVCHGLNVLGSEETAASLTVIEIDIRPPPVIILGPNNQTLKVNELGILPCQTSGKPTPVVRWFYNSQPIVKVQPRISVLSSGTLQISGVKHSDSGQYTCKAISETGATSWTAFLLVSDHGPFYRMAQPSAFPDAPSKPTSSDVTDTSVTLVWSGHQMSSKAPVLDYTVQYFSYQTSESWVTVSQSVVENVFTVRDLKPAAKYVFVVRARNVFGVSGPSPPSDLIEIDRPSTPLENILIHKENDIIHIRWAYPYKVDAGDVLGFQIYCTDDFHSNNCSQTTDQSETSASLKGINPRRTYRISVAVRTLHGIRSRSRTFVVGPEESKITEEPWFMGMLISTIGGVIWLGLCIFSIWLCRKRKQKKTTHNGLYSAVPSHNLNDNKKVMFFTDNLLCVNKEDALYPQKCLQLGVGLSKNSSDRSNVENSGGYSVAMSTNGNIVPQLTTFYQTPKPTVLSVAPYATTTLIGVTGCNERSSLSRKKIKRNNADILHHSAASGNGNFTYCVDSVFRPINHAYVHSSNSDSAESYAKPESVSVKSQISDVLPSTGCQMEAEEIILKTMQSEMQKSLRQKLLDQENGGGVRSSVNWPHVLPPPPERHPSIEIESSNICPDNHVDFPQTLIVTEQLIGTNSPLSSPLSKISACSCPIPQGIITTQGRLQKIPSLSEAEYSSRDYADFPFYNHLRPNTENTYTVDKAAISVGTSSWLEGYKTPEHIHSGTYHGLRRMYYSPTIGNPDQVDIAYCTHNGYHGGREPYSDHLVPEGVELCQLSTEPQFLHGYCLPEIDSRPAFGESLRDSSCAEDSQRFSCICGDGAINGEYNTVPNDHSYSPTVIRVVANNQHLHECFMRNIESPLSDGVEDYAMVSDHTMEGFTPDHATANTMEGLTPDSCANEEAEKGRHLENKRCRKRQPGLGTTRAVSPYSTDSNFSAAGTKKRQTKPKRKRLFKVQGDDA